MLLVVTKQCSHLSDNLRFDRYTIQVGAMKPIPQNLGVICLYDGAGVENFDTRQIGEYLGQWFGPDCVQIRSEFVRHHLRSHGRMDEQTLESRARDICKARIEDPANPLEKREPNPEQLVQERKWLLQGVVNREVFYDGLALQRTYLELLVGEETSLEFVHIVFTNRLIGTWDQSDRRYHARVSVYGWPSVISTTGVVEAPARPREYYFGFMAGLDERQLREELAGRFIDYGDPRLTDLLKGYTMQAVFYHLLGDPFCDNPDCRLFNAHWQEQMIRAQLGPGGEFCSKHQKLLKELADK